eukprot:4172959-Alexandrium_andersonii.AAC.1
MSASLVGSEMCIRDRPLRRAPAEKCSQKRSCARCSLCPGSVRCLVGAVSYTHLTLPTICSV